MGPRKAAKQFLDELPAHAKSCKVTLYGALAATGKGHLTDRAILEVLTPHMPTEILWAPETILPFHTNGMNYAAFDANGNQIANRTY